MSTRGAELNVVNNEYTIVLLVCTVIGFVLGAIWLYSAFSAVRQENANRTSALGISCLLSFICPIAAVIAGKPNCLKFVF